MVFRGSLSDITLPDVLRLAALSCRTGALRLHREGAEGVVWFRDGAVVLARSDQASALLGTMLVDAGVVARSDLERALTVRDEQPERGRRIGDVLLEMGAVSAGDLEAFLRDQIHRAVKDLLGWEGGGYEFQESEAGATSEMGPAVTVAELLGERARRAPAAPVPGPAARETVTGLLQRLARDTDGQALCQEDRRVFLLPGQVEHAERPLAPTRPLNDAAAGSFREILAAAPSEPEAGAADDDDVLESGRLATSGGEGLAGELTALTGAELPVSPRGPGDSRPAGPERVGTPRRDPQVTRDVLEAALQRLLEL